MEEKLKEIFGYVNNWLNFAEAKNAAILTVSIGGLFGISSYEDKINIICYIILMILLIGSILSSLMSFYPNLGNSKIEFISKYLLYMAEIFDNKKSVSNNIKIKIFYGDIARNYSEETEEEYVKNLYNDYYNDTPAIITLQEKEYAKEIIINSKITKNKYDYFKISLNLLIIFMFCFVVMITYQKITANEKKIDIKGSVTIIERVEGKNGK